MSWSLLSKSFLFLLVLVLAPQISAFAQSKRTTTNEWVIWAYGTEQIEWKERWSANLSTQYRHFMDRPEGFHIFLSGGVNYKLAHGFSIGGGFTNLNINDEFEGVELLLSELRPYQHLQLQYPAGKTQFTWRLMVEERFLKGQPMVRDCRDTNMCGVLGISSCFCFHWQSRLILRSVLR